MDSFDQPCDTVSGGTVARCARASMPSELSTLVYIVATAVDICGLGWQSRLTFGWGMSCFGAGADAPLTLPC